MQTISILETGAIPDGKTLATAAIQKAIARCAEAGGGRVVIPAGRFLTGMVRLRSNIELHLSRGSVLLASSDPDDSKPWTSLERSGDHWRQAETSAWHLILAEDCTDIALTGPGALDGQGHLHYPEIPHGEIGWPRSYHSDGRRPGALVQLTRCARVKICDVQLGNVANWTMHLYDCDHVRIRDLLILNPAEAPNADGIDLTGCHWVTISGCHIDTCDDAICLKTMPHSRTCENVTVLNCVLRTSCAALKLGAGESFQDMRNVVFSSCTVSGSSRGIALYSLEGAVLENISVDNIVCDTRAPLMFTRPIHVDVRKKSPSSRVGAVRNLRISGMLAETNGRCLFTAADGGVIEDVVLDGLHLRYPVVDDPQPHAAHFGGGQFSAHSPWARQVRAALIFDGVDGLTLRNVQIRWPHPDETPAPGWQPGKKLANGDDRIFHPEDWKLDPETPFAALALRETTVRLLEDGGLTGFQGGPLHADPAETTG